MKLDTPIETLEYSLWQNFLIIFFVNKIQFIPLHQETSLYVVGKRTEHPFSRHEVLSQSYFLECMMIPFSFPVINIVIYSGLQSQFL